ncbi:hypothetical protein [Halorussus aquaticus]|uniref:AAA domain-containing protein n=1 Tax=Halorussus aquaticus TaxID=2953748 RepID=A0ABD5Q3G1_9EURY|nr:hypothetical protein [Halorussus aquaticus]
MSDGGWQPARTADDVRSGEVDASIDAILTDDEAIGNIMLAAERAGLSEDSPLVASLGREERSRVLREARQTGQATSMNMATGLAESSEEATGYDMLIKRLTPAAQQSMVKGPKGSGKTVFVLDLAKRLYAEFDGELSIATNIKGPDEHEAVTFIETMSEMLEWVRDTPGEKLVIGDEWSTTMNAHAHPGGDVRTTVSRFVNALRKGEGGSTRLMIVGHEHDTDIAAILRKQSDVVIEKAGKADEGLADQAAVYDGWNDYVQQDYAFTLRGLQDVPEDSVWGADTNYFAYFEPDLDDPRNQIQRGKLIEDWEQYQETDDPGSSGEDPRCQAEKKGGGQCPQGAVFPRGDDPVVCHGHRDKLDELSGDGDTAREGRDTGSAGAGSDGGGEARDAATGAKDALSALQVATGDREGDDADRYLIAAALQREHPEDLSDDDAQRMAEMLMESDAEDPET